MSCYLRIVLKLIKEEYDFLEISKLTMSLLCSPSNCAGQQGKLGQGKKFDGLDAATKARVHLNLPTDSALRACAEKYR